MFDFLLVKIKPMAKKWDPILTIGERDYEQIADLGKSPSFI